MERKKGRKVTRPPAAAAPAVAAVLGDDDLLCEILVRVDFPTCLVRAALVSKRWLRQASDPAFLRRFRKLHPPRLLGLYVTEDVGLPRPRFVPLPQLPELGVVFHRANFPLGATRMGVIAHCRNARLLVFFYTDIQYGVCSPLHPAGDLPTAVPRPRGLEGIHGDRHYEFPEDGGDGLSCNLVVLARSGRKFFAKQFVMRAGGRDEVRTSDSIEPPASWRSYRSCSLLLDNKLYMLGETGYIIGLDLGSMSLFLINLPDGVQRQDGILQLELLLADDSGFYLIHVMGFQIHVWLYGTDGDNAGNWQLVDTICVRQAIGHLARPTWESAWKSVYRVQLHRVGDNAELLLKVEHEVFYMHIRSRKVEKVFETAPKAEGGNDFLVCPFTMVWPPTFPALINE